MKKYLLLLLVLVVGVAAGFTVNKDESVLLTKEEAFQTGKVINDLQHENYILYNDLLDTQNKLRKCESKIRI